MRRVRLGLYFFCFNLVVLNCVGQNDFTPAAFVNENEELEQAFKKARTEQIARFDDMNKHGRKMVKEALEAREEMMLSMLHSGSFIFDSPVNDHLQGIFSKILAANPQIDPNTQLLLSRSGSPNAFTTGDGFFVINLGLVAHFSSDDQLAFVIGHELSHQVSDHVYQAIRNHISVASDPERVKAIKRVLRSEYQVITKLENLIVPGMMASMQFSRENELEADMQGAAFSTGAGYDIHGSIGALDVLDQVDTLLYDSTLPWQEFYESITCDVSPVWEMKKGTSLGIFELPDHTMLRTHPDCAIRIDNIRKNHGVDDSTTQAAPDSAYLAIRKMARMDLVESYRKRGNYGRALYHSLHLFHEDRSTPYVSETTAQLFAIIYLSKKQRILGNYVELSDPTNPADLNKYLDVIWEMSADDCACAAFNIIKHCPTVSRPEENLSTQAITHFARGEVETAHKLASEYLLTYPEGRYTGRMNYILKRK